MNMPRFVMIEKRKEKKKKGNKNMKNHIVNLMNILQNKNCR